MNISRDAIPLDYVAALHIEGITIPGVELKNLPFHQYLMFSPKQTIAYLDHLFAIWDVSEKDQVKLLCLTAEELTRWRVTGKVQMTLPLIYQICTLIDIHRGLIQECHDEKAIQEWIHSPQKAFLMRTPLDYMQATYPGFVLDRINRSENREGLI